MGKLLMLMLMFEWCKVVIFMDSFVAWDRSHDFFHKNKLPYICSMYDTGFKVLSMKITTLHHSNISISIRSLPMKISYLTFLGSLFSGASS
jgi:hypothetical protein